MARRFSSHPVRSTKRTSVWLSVNLGTSTLTASTLSLIGSLNAAALALRPFTIVRTRMDVVYASDQQSASETTFGAMGIIVASDKAVALGSSAVPGPIAQADGNWFQYQGLADVMRFGTNVGFQSVGHHYEIDSSAMRKVTVDEDIAIMAEQSAALGATIVIMGRMLVKLH